MDFKNEIVELLCPLVGIPAEEIENIIEAPSDSNMGDFAFPCFKLSKLLKKAPQIIAEEIGSKIVLPKYISRLHVVGAYINFFINKEMYASDVIGEILSKGDDYATSEMGKGLTVVVDYSSPNVAKPFHVGHLRSTVIGNSLIQIFKKLSYTTVGINHLGDWGTQFGKLIVAYKLWGDQDTVTQEGVNELNRLYVRYHKESKENRKLDDDARAWFVKMQEGDEEALSLWKWFCDVSMKEFENVYDVLGVKFDYNTGESFYNDKMDTVIQELKAKELLIKSEGAQIVDLTEYNLPPCLIVRGDGGTLYATRDITACLYRKETFYFHKCLYLTAVDQKLHFSQFFSVIEKMGYPFKEQLIHVPFGLVSLNLGDGVKKLSTREGNVILMQDLLEEAVAKTLTIIEEKNSDLPDKKTVAQKVGIGAVIFNDLYNSRIKDVVFSWDKMLNFDGETGPYVQYTHARACSILKKAAPLRLEQIDYSFIQDDASFLLCKLLNEYKDKIVEAAEKCEPFIITRHLVAIAQAFNRFYHDNPILTSGEEIKKARLSIVFCVKTILYQGLALLGIKAPSQM